MVKEKEDSKSEFDAKDILKFFKKNWNWLVLAIILIIGFNLRVYHLDYPVVGYHNWKEVHYLTEARNFAEEGFFKYGFFIPAHDYPHIDEDLRGAHTDTFPTVSVIVGFFFKIFGVKLAVARLVNIFLVLGAVALSYLIMKKLFNRENLALTTALLFSINPLFVFFGRQTQLINPALFFMMLSIFFFLKWRESPKMKYMIIFALSLSLSILTKYSFALIGLPLLAIFPYKRIFKFDKLKKYLKQYIVGAACLLLTPAWWLYTKIIAPRFMTAVADIQMNFSVIFQSSFWQTLKAYAADNYTIVGLVFAIIGLILMIVFFLKDKKNIGYRFVLSYFIAAIIWFIVMSWKLSGHNYHQYPVAPLIIMLIAYSFIVIATNIQKLIKIKFLRYFIILGLFLIVLFPSLAAKNRMFDTQFPGLDVAGEYIKENSKPNERIFFPSGQSYGVLWHADRKGDKTPFNDLARFKDGESKNMTWVFVYQWGFEVMNYPEVWDYIQENYELKQFAYYKTDPIQPVYLLLKKGGSFNMSNINEILQNKQTYTKDYELSEERIIRLYYVNI